MKPKERKQCKNSQDETVALVVSPLFPHTSLEVWAKKEKYHKVVFCFRIFCFSNLPFHIECTTYKLLRFNWFTVSNWRHSKRNKNVQIYKVHSRKHQNMQTIHGTFSIILWLLYEYYIHQAGE